MPRRIAHLTTIDLSLRYLLLAQIDASVAAGDEVLGISARGPDVPFLESHGLRFVELEGSTRSMSLGGDLRAARSLWRTLRRERPDVLHTHNPKPGVYGRILGRLAGVPLVVHTTHGLYAAPDDPLPKRLVVYGLEAVASRFSHVELVQNPEDLDLMRRWRIAPRRKLRLLGNGVDLDRLRARPTRPSAQAVRADLGLAPDDVVVGLVARLVAEKGIPELIEAVAPARPAVPAPGDRPARSREGRRAARGAARPGPGERAPCSPATARTSTGSTRPWTCSACRRTARASRARPWRRPPAACPSSPPTSAAAARSWTPGVTGDLVPVRDPAALAAALRALRRPGAAAPRAGAAGRAKAEADFDEADVVARVLAAYGARPRLTAAQDPRRRPRRRRPRRPSRIATRTPGVATRRSRRAGRRRAPPRAGARWPPQWPGADDRRSRAERRGQPSVRRAQEPAEQRVALTRRPDDRGHDGDHPTTTAPPRAA